MIFQFNGFHSLNELLPKEINLSFVTTVRKTDLQTSIAIQSGDSGTFLRIPVIEGNNKRADRNQLIGYLEVSGRNFNRDVPLGRLLKLQ